MWSELLLMNTTWVAVWMLHELTVCLGSSYWLNISFCLDKPEWQRRKETPPLIIPPFLPLFIPPSLPVYSSILFLYPSLSSSSYSFLFILFLRLLIHPLSIVPPDSSSLFQSSPTSSSFCSVHLHCHISSSWQRSGQTTTALIVRLAVCGHVSPWSSGPHQ